ncbi:MAG: hypothetical protein ACI89X_002146 [Planctomycetota bacterium]
MIPDSGVNSGSMAAGDKSSVEGSLSSAQQQSAAMRSRIAKPCGSTGLALVIGSL